MDVPQFRREWRASVSIGAVSFFAPFLAAGGFAYWALDWNLKQAEIAGIALSTTSLAVVYAVLVETGLNQELVGKWLMSGPRRALCDLADRRRPAVLPAASEAAPVRHRPAEEFWPEPETGA